MSLVVAVLLTGLLLGWFAGGSLKRLGGVELRQRRLVVAGLLVQLAGTVVGGPFYPAGLVLSALLVLAFLARNRGLRGTGLVALGLLANAVVVGANGAMPVSPQATARAGVTTAGLVADPRHELADERTRLSWLGDVVPVPLPYRPEVVSPGDVLVAAGLAQLVVVGMLAWRAAVPVDRDGRARRALPAVGTGRRPRDRRVAPWQPSSTGGPPWPSEVASVARARRALPTTASVPTRRTQQHRQSPGPNR